MKKGLIAITFPDINGATQMLDALNKSMQGDLAHSSNVLIVEKDARGDLKIKKSSPVVNGMPTCCELNFVVGLLLRGAVAKDLFGEAVGTLLMHPINLGISPEKIEKLTKDLALGNSVLFVQDCSRLNGTFEFAFNPANGSLHDLAMSDTAIQDVQIMSSTLNHYWT